MKIDLNSYNEFFVAQKMISLTNRYLVTDSSNSVLLYSKQKLFKLKEDFRFYFDVTEKEPALTIKAQNILDFSGKYDVIDEETQSVIGRVKREGWTSIIKGKWYILGTDDSVLAEVSEDSTALALLRRFVDFISLLVPVEFMIRKEGVVLGTIKKKRNLIRDRYYINLTADQGKVIDRRLAIALAVLLDSINSQ